MSHYVKNCVTISTPQKFLRSFLVILWVLSAACSPGPPSSELNASRDSGAQSDATSNTDSDSDTGVESDAQDDAGDTGITGPVITVATYNTYLLFDTICDSARCSDGDFERQPSQAEFDARIAQVAAAIDEMDADVVLLQEIEKQSVLDALNAALEKPYPIAELAESGYAASVDVAVLARGEATDVKIYTELNGGLRTFSRPLLRVDLDLYGERAIVFSTHFKSKNNDDAARRIAEAQTARDIVMDVASTHDGALVILGGDLNDTPDSQTLLELTINDGLIRVAAGEHILDVFTYVFRQRREELDHLLMARTLGGAYVRGSVHSLHDAEPSGWGGSDHGALVGRFEMR